MDSPPREQISHRLFTRRIFTAERTTLLPIQSGWLGDESRQSCCALPVKAVSQKAGRLTVDATAPPAHYCVMKLQTYTAVFRKDEGWWIGWVEQIPGVNSQGKTRAELLKNLLRSPRSPGAEPRRSSGSRREGL